MKKEWIIRVLKTLEKEEYNQVLKKAKSSGLKVNSFRDVTKVPLASLYGALNSSKKQITENMVCIGEAIIFQSECALKEDKDNKRAELRSKIAEFVLHKGTMTEETIQKMLEELEESVEQQKNPKDTKEDAEKEQAIAFENDAKGISELKRQITDLNEAAERIKEKSENQAKKIKQLNMDNENQEKYIKKLEKELHSMKACQDKEAEYEKLQQRFKNLQEEYDSICEAMKARESELAIANEQLLCYQEENSRKVLCFTKGKLEPNRYPGYQIQSAASFEINHLIHWEDYDDIWVITKDFSYATIREIERASKKQVQRFYSHKMITTV